MICDISEHQGAIDWDALAPQLDFVVIKASGLYGNGSDPYYERNMTEAVAHGVPFHAYHFLYCVTEVQAKRDAKLFFDTVKAAGKWPLFWVLDCESQWGIADNQAAPIGRIFEDELRRLAQEQGPGEIQVAIYVGQEMYKRWAFDYSHFAYVWIPGYGEKYKPPMPCDMWQYTSKGKLPGINGDVDLNTLCGDKPMEFFIGKESEVDTMAKIKLMPIKKFVAELEAAVKRKDGYIMGSYGQNPRTGYLDLSVPESKCKSAWKPTGYYYNQYKNNAKQHAQALKWRKQCTRVWDCNGLAEGIYELYTGVCINSKSRHNYAQWCSPKGKGMIPVERRVPGAAVFWSDTTASKIHHVAYLWKPVKEGHPEGDWYLIEACGVMFGVRGTNKLLSRKPNFWGWMTKYFDYSDSPTPPEPTKKTVEITGDSVNVRSAPGTTNTRVIGVVNKGDKLPYQGLTAEMDGRDWYMVEYRNMNGWVSSKYAKVV